MVGKFPKYCMKMTVDSSAAPELSIVNLAIPPMLGAKLLPSPPYTIGRGIAKA
jgi:hypothetical protein